MKKISALLMVIFMISLIAQPRAVAAQITLPAGATITEATLAVNIFSSSGKEVTVHRVTSHWNENSVTWETFDGDFGSTVIDSFTPTSLGWQTMDVRDTVQDWVDGVNPNFGFLLKESQPPADGLFTRVHSSESSFPDRRPRLDFCYTAPGVSETCVSIQRTDSDPDAVLDTYIRSDEEDVNFGSEDKFFVNLRTNEEKQALIRFNFTIENPDVSIIKYTNGQLADDPNGADVPRIAPGQPVVWTYRVSNIGTVAIDRADVVVTDDQPGVTPVFDSVLTGDMDTLFEPGEVWWYKATGVAVDLLNPPPGVKTFPGYCTSDGTLDPSTAYINQGTVTVPGDSDTAPSSYCNPSEVVFLYNHYLPFASSRVSSVYTTPFQVTIGYEDLPLALSANDYDYNDWIVDIIGVGQQESLSSTRYASIELDFSPNGRGATLKHSFGIIIPAGTFPGSGSYTLTINGPSGVVSTQNGTFNAAVDQDFMIFPDTAVVFPADFSNTLEAKPMVAAQRTAKLVFKFNTPVNFDFTDYDYTAAHGAGLFFNPYLAVLGSTDVIDRGDLRLLNVPEQSGSLSPFTPYEWPEEWMRIDRVYTNLTFIPANPPTQPYPDIVFTNNWWMTHNNCVIDDVVCPLPVTPTNMLDYANYPD